MARTTGPSRALGTSRRALLPAAAAALFLLASGYAAVARNPARPMTPQAARTQPIRARVNLVNTPVVVRGRNGKLLLDLTQKDFRVLDNGVEQTIESFDMGGSPLSLVIVVETSTRIAAFLPALRRTGVLFTQTVMGARGDAAVVGYSDDAQTLLGFTGDHEAIERTLSKLPEGPAEAHLYDALARGVQMLRSRPDSRRRVVIVLAEDLDTGSEEKLGQVLRDAQQAGIAIYPVSLSSTAAALRGQPRPDAPVSITPPGTFGLPPMPGTPQTPSTEAERSGNLDLGALAVWIVQHAGAAVHEPPLEIAAAATGGLYQSVFREREILKAIDEISGELHAQYVLSYRPASAGGDYHQIKVEVKGRRGAKVRTRSGYYLAAPAG